MKKGFFSSATVYAGFTLRITRTHLSQAFDWAFSSTKTSSSSYGLLDFVVGRLRSLVLFRGCLEPPRDFTFEDGEPDALGLGGVLPGPVDGAVADRDDRADPLSAHVVEVGLDDLDLREGRRVC